jgi:predicted transposase YdaD
MKYDAILKELFQISSSKLVEMLVGENIRVEEYLNTHLR